MVPLVVSVSTLHAVVELPTKPAFVPVILALAGMALLLGGMWLDAFILVMALAVLGEFVLLATGGTEVGPSRILALVAGTSYIGIAAVFLMRTEGSAVFMFASGVAAFEIVASLVDWRSRGRKIAPSVNASRTWRGFGSGVVGASAMLLATSQLYATPLCQWYYDAWDSFDPPLPPGVFSFDDRCHIWSPPIGLALVGMALLAGFLYAVFAQSGDLLARWIVRNADPNSGSAPTVERGGLIVFTGGLFAVVVVSGVARMTFA